MKSTLKIITVLATIACAGLPAKAVDTEIENRASIVGVIATAQCYVNTGMLTQEQADKIIRDYQKAYPNVKPAYKWVTTSRNGKAAVKAIAPYFSSDCKDTTIPTDKIGELLMPYLK